MKYISIIVLILLSKVTVVQNNLYEIEYVFVANNDNMIQGVDKLFYDSFKNKIVYKKGKTEIIKDNTSINEDEIVIEVILKNINPEFIYIDLEKNILYNQITPLQKTYLTKESIPILNWKITEELKKVNEIELTKATTTFRGRTYEVWFSYDHPISIGPWKFNGLPGLIFEVIELAETNNYSWKLKSLKTKKGILPFNNPLDRNLIDIKKFKDAFFEEYIEYENIILTKIDLDLPPSSKEEIIAEFKEYQKLQIEKKYEWEE